MCSKPVCTWRPSRAPGEYRRNAAHAPLSAVSYRRTISIPGRSTVQARAGSAAVARRSLKTSRKTSITVAPLQGLCPLADPGLLGSAALPPRAARSSGVTDPLESADDVVGRRRPSDDPALGADHFQGGLFELREVTLGAIFEQQARVAAVV